jgi:hypothetical protein
MLVVRKHEESTSKMLVVREIKESTSKMLVVREHEICSTDWKFVVPMCDNCIIVKENIRFLKFFLTGLF